MLSAEEVSPSVSVVVTAYNHGRFIRQALDSVLAQTLWPAEVLVVDDGSTDDTRSILASYGERIKPILRANRGVAAARNEGVARARGELIAFLDADDVWSPEKLAVQANALRRHPGAAMVGVDGYEFDEGGTLAASLFGSAVDGLFPDGEDIVAGRFYRALVRSNFIATTSQVLLRTDVLEGVGPSNTRLAVASDYDLYLRIAADYDICLVRTPLVGWRYLASGASGPRELREFRWGLETLHVLRRHAREGPPADREFVRREYRWRLERTAQRAYLYGRERDRRFARRYLGRLIRQHPRSRHAVAYLLALSAPASVVRTLGRRMSLDPPSRPAGG